MVSMARASPARNLGESKLPRALRSAVLGAMAGLALASQARAVPVAFGFSCITNNQAANCAVGEAQLQVVASEVGPDVLLTFTNSGPIGSTIARIYFDDGALMDGPFIDNSSPGSVLFTDNFPGPGNLVGGSMIDPPFVATKAFTSGAESPPSGFGVDPGEFVGLTFTLMAGMDFNDLIADLNDGSLRIGLHVIMIGASQDSEGFISNTVPEPATLLLIALGLGALGARARPTA